MHVCLVSPTPAAVLALISILHTLDAQPRLCCLVACAAGLLMAPGIRYGRLLQSFLEPPAWAHNLKPKLTDKLVAQAGFALQLVLIPLWVTSMVDVLRLPGAGVPVLRGVVMLLAGALQARAAPCLLQVRPAPHMLAQTISSRHSA